MTAPVEAVVRQALALRQDETLEIVSMPGTKDAGGGTRARAFSIPFELDDAVTWTVAEASRPLRTVSVGIGCLTPAAAERINAPGGWPRASGTRAIEEGIDLLLGYAWVAVDLDPDKTEPETLEQLAERLQGLPAPSMLASSGRGLHAWWRLQRLCPEASGRELLRVLAAATKGDTGTAQPTRALRLPGTWNHKSDAGCHATILAATEQVHDGAELYRLASALAPAAPPAVAAPPRAPRPLHEGPDLRERARSRLSLPDLLDKACGPATRAGWSCFCHDDGTPSLRLVQGTEDAAICYGSGHPATVGLPKDGYVVLDVFDVLAWTWGVETGVVVRDLVAEERARDYHRPGPAAGTPGLLALLDTARGRA